MTIGHKTSASLTLERKGKRALILALQEGSKSKGELKEALKRAQKEGISDDAIRKKLERALGELRELGLVEERGGKYCWYFYMNVFQSHEDYAAKLEHSRLLIPALEQLAGFAPHVNPEDIEMLVSCAMTHLRAHPRILGLLQDRGTAIESANRAREKFIGDLEVKMVKEFDVQAMDPDKAPRHQIFLGSTIPSSIYSLMRFRSQPSYKIANDELWLGGSAMLARGTHLFPKIQGFIEREVKDEENSRAIEDVKVLEEKVLTLQRELQQEIRKLILKINSGEPLALECDTCPKVLFTP